MNTYVLDLLPEEFSPHACKYQQTGKTKHEIKLNLLSNKTVFSLGGDRGSTVVKVLCYKSVGCCFVPSWCQWIFH